MEYLVVGSVWTLRILAAFVLAATIIPFIRSGSWVVRIFDFPRVQMAVLAAVVIVGTVALSFGTGWRRDAIAIIAAALIAGIVQGVFIARYTSMWKPTVASGSERHLRLLISNVDIRNTRHGEVADRITDADADVALLIEVDQDWLAGLQMIRDTYPNRVEHVRHKGRGMVLWSRVPISETASRFLVTDRRPSIWATIAVDGRSVRFVGVHPTPPGLPRPDDEGLHDSRIRDAELVLVAGAIAEESDQPWIVAGDFNDVAWSHTTRLFERISGLDDPRVGRGLLNTYHAQYPPLRYPLDHVFVSNGLRLVDLRRVKMPGSDHFAVVADFELAPHPDPSGDAGATPEQAEEAQDMIESGRNDADGI